MTDITELLLDFLAAYLGDLIEEDLLIDKEVFPINKEKISGSDEILNQSDHSVLILREGK